MKWEECVDESEAFVTAMLASVVRSLAEGPKTEMELDQVCVCAIIRVGRPESHGSSNRSMIPLPTLSQVYLVFLFCGNFLGRQFVLLLLALARHGLLRGGGNTAT